MDAHRENGQYVVYAGQLRVSDTVYSGAAKSIIIYLYLQKIKPIDEHGRQDNWSEWHEESACAFTGQELYKTDFRFGRYISFQKLILHPFVCVIETYII